MRRSECDLPYRSMGRGRGREGWACWKSTRRSGCDLPYRLIDGKGKGKGKKKAKEPGKPPPDPDTHLRIWMPACMVNLVEPELVDGYEEVVRRREGKKAGRGLRRKKTGKGKGKKEEEAVVAWFDEPSDDGLEEKVKATKTTTKNKTGTKPQAKKADIDIGDVERRQRLESQRQHFGVGRGAIGAAERFDASLQKLAGLMVTIAEHRPEIAEAGRLSGSRGGKVVAGHGDREVRPQAQFLTLRVGGEIQALADVLAGEVEKRLGRLQDRRLGMNVAGLRKRLQQGVRPGGGF